MGTNIFEVYVGLSSFLVTNLLYRSTWQTKTAHITDTLALPIFVRTMYKALIKTICSVINNYP